MKRTQTRLLELVAMVTRWSSVGEGEPMFLPVWQVLSHITSITPFIHIYPPFNTHLHTCRFPPWSSLSPSAQKWITRIAIRAISSFPHFLFSVKGSCSLSFTMLSLLNCRHLSLWVHETSTHFNSFDFVCISRYQMVLLSLAALTLLCDVF